MENLIEMPHKVSKKNEEKIDSISKPGVLKGFNHKDMNHEYEVVADDITILAHKVKDSVDKALDKEHEESADLKTEAEKESEAMAMLFGP